MQLKYAVPVFVPVALLISLGPASATYCGDAYFNHDIDWPNTSSLYYSVAGAPPNTCGDLYADRNGSGYVLNAADWICTDSYGNATKGPWSSNPDDETASVYIDWGTCFSPIRSHIWDVDPPTVDVTSSCPGTFAGTASDDDWGAGFDSDWAACYGAYYDSTTDRWWDPGTGQYNATEAVILFCTCSGMPSLDITWSCGTKPSSHTSGHNYTWYAWSWDGGQLSLPDTCGFTG